MSSEMITKNFSRKELSCRCGCGGVIEDEIFLNNLQRLRDMFRYPMYVSSGFRCSYYNMEVSTTGPNGPHTIAAVDIVVYGERAFRLLWMATSCGFTGVGLNQKGPYSDRFMHLDMLRNEGRPWVWTY